MSLDYLFIKLWIFDASDGSGRLLKCRTAHSQPPTHIRYYGTSGQILLSAGIIIILSHFVLHSLNHANISETQINESNMHMMVFLSLEIILFKQNGITEFFLDTLAFLSTFFCNESSCLCTIICALCTNTLWQF